jgi:N-acetylglucosaminyldiphosphoundecaprenol N-acetyl-beta-D-mannosaminyltransferase
MNIQAYIQLGIGINPMDVSLILRVISDKIHNREKCIIGSQNLHSIYIYHNDLKMRYFQRISYLRIDGMPLIICGRALGYPVERRHRVTWVDLIYPLIKEIQEKRWRIFYLGSRPDVAHKGTSLLKERFPGLQIAYAHGYFDQQTNSLENKQRLDAIRGFNPDILIVGMGMPKQEHWILDNLDDINATVILTSGAAMEYIAGVVSTPPRWMGKAGLEWLYRLIENPRRFWKRYLVEPWFILGLFLNDLFNRYILRRDLRVVE